ncbi:uncharacterized protein FA14DRAFT_181015 [Meira miltonrushii]|uniref:Trichohyalin-like n=1 Tax=Meira miltonrushii TaxID=1280837 RepID=A0A316VBB5_9BASI|nr:uncharacterized protein FA14DRAFT_181015 [Meira miltonrushii]PWN34388.1 hypothetical protein FA14DRAFT_181015 [Meira miltonrushii]
MLTVISLSLSFETIQVLGQTKEPKDFDLNKTPPPEDVLEGETVHSQYPIDKTGMTTDTLNKAEVVRKKTKRKRKAEVDLNEENERKRAYSRERSRRRRQGLLERNRGKGQKRLYIDLNRTPSLEPEDVVALSPSQQNAEVQSNQGHPNRPSDINSGQTIQLDQVDPNDPAERRRKRKQISNAKRDRRADTERQKKRRQQLRERQLAGTLLQSDIRHLETKRKKDKAYRVRKKKEIQEYALKWRQKNSGYNKDRVRQWKEQHPEKVNEYRMKYREKERLKKKALSEKQDDDAVKYLILYFALMQSMHVHGQMKRTRSFDLNETPSPASSPGHDTLLLSLGQQNGDSHSYPEHITGNQIGSTNAESAIHGNSQTANHYQSNPSKEPKRWKRKPKIIISGKSEKQREVERLASKRYRDRIRERKLAGTLTEQDMRYFENMKKRKKKYEENHLEEIRDHHAQWREKNRQRNNEKRNKLRSENLERAREKESQYRERNRVTIRKRRMQFYYRKKEQNNQSKADENNN